jgi:hypothetical protein
MYSLIVFCFQSCLEASSIGVPLFLRKNQITFVCETSENNDKREFVSIAGAEILVRAAVRDLIVTEDPFPTVLRDHTAV